MVIIDFLFAHYLFSSLRFIRIIIYNKTTYKATWLYAKGAENMPECGKYRHFKGNEYEVIAIAKHTETLEDMVVYRALYGDFNIWVRPLAMWNQEVEVHGKIVKRFEKI